MDDFRSARRKVLRWGEYSCGKIGLGVPANPLRATPVKQPRHVSRASLIIVRRVSLAHARALVAPPSPCLSLSLLVCMMTHSCLYTPYCDFQKTLGSARAPAFSSAPSLWRESNSQAEKRNADEVPPYLSQHLRHQFDAHLCAHTRTATDRAHENFHLAGRSVLARRGCCGALAGRFSGPARPLRDTPAARFCNKEFKVLRASWGGKPCPARRTPGKAQVWPRAPEGTKRSPV